MVLHTCDLLKIVLLCTTTCDRWYIYIYVLRESERWKIIAARMFMWFVKSRVGFETGTALFDISCVEVHLEAAKWLKPWWTNWERSVTCQNARFQVFARWKQSGKVRDHLCVTDIAAARSDWVSKVARAKDFPAWGMSLIVAWPKTCLKFICYFFWMMIGVQTLPMSLLNGLNKLVKIAGAARNARVRMLATTYS